MYHFQWCRAKVITKVENGSPHVVVAAAFVVALFDVNRVCRNGNEMAACTVNMQPEFFLEKPISLTYFAIHATCLGGHKPPPKLLEDSWVTEPC